MGAMGTLGLPSDLPQTDLFAPMENVPEVGDGAGLGGSPAIKQPPLRDRPPSLDGKKPFHGLTQWMQKELRDATPHVEKWRNQAKEAYRFLAGKQFKDSDLTMMAARGRAVAAFNNVQKFHRFVSGIMRRAPIAMLFLPLIEDQQQQQMYADYLTRTNEWWGYVSNQKFHQSRVFDDLLTCGMAWSDTFIDKHKDPAGLPGYKRLNPLEMKWPQTGEANLGGTRWRARESDIPIDQAIRKWPDMKSYIQTITGQSDMQYPAREMPNVIKYVMPYIWSEPINRIAGGSQGPKKDKAPVTEFQWWEDEMGVYFFDPIQSMDRWMPENKFRRYRDNVESMFKARIQDYDRVEKRTFWRTFLLANQYMLEMPKRLPTEDDFVFNALTGGWNEHDKLWYGFVQSLINPQEYANRYMNQLIEIVAYQGKGGMLYETDAVDEGQAKELEMNYAKPGAWTRVRPGALTGNKIREKQTGQLPEAAMQVMQFAINSMTNVTGLDPQSFSQPSSTTSSGTAGRQRMFAGLLLLAQEFDSFAQFKRKDAEIVLAHLRLLADDRLIAVGDPGDPSLVKLMKAPFQTRTQVFIEESDLDPNARQVWQDQILSLAPALIRTNHFIPEILDIMLLPAKFRNKLKQAIQQSAQKAEEMSKQGLQMGGRGKPRSIEEIQAHVQGMRTKAALDMAKAQSLLGQNRRDDLTAVLSGLMDVHQEQRNRQQHSLDMARGAVDVGMGMVPQQPQGGAPE